MAKKEPGTALIALKQIVEDWQELDNDKKRFDANDAIERGRLLLQAKPQLATKGAFKRWVEKDLEVTVSYAYRMMKAYEAAEKGEKGSISDLSKLTSRDKGTAQRENKEEYGEGKSTYNHDAAAAQAADADKRRAEASSWAKPKSDTEALRIIGITLDDGTLRINAYAAKALGFTWRGASLIADEKSIKDLLRKMAGFMHPDKGGSEQDMARLNAAKAYFKE